MTAMLLERLAIVLGMALLCCLILRSGEDE